VIDTSAVVPVDLNAILYRVERGLSRLLTDVGVADAAHLSAAAARRRQAMDALLWDRESGSYRDLLLSELASANQVSTVKRFSEVVSLSDFSVPLWAGLHGPDGEIIVDRLRQSGLLMPGGAASTTMTTGQQWDGPNAWAPLQLMLIEGLRKVGPPGTELSKEMSNTWLQSGLLAWQCSGYMYEKYNASMLGQGGDGGEYEPQVGFGWSNGVVLSLLTSPEAITLYI